MNRDGIRLLLAGRSGMGKSYFAKKKLIPALAKTRPVIIFDRKLEYAGSRSIDAGKNWKLNRSIYSFFGALKEEKKLNSGVHVIHCKSVTDYVDGLNFFQKLSRPVTIILDEAHEVYKARDFSAAKEPLLKMVRWGRSEGIDVIIITQRTMDIPPDIRSQLSALISFNQNHADDIKEIYKMGYIEAEKIQQLKPREKMILGEIPKKIKKKLSG